MTLRKAFLRRKRFEEIESKLARVLNLFDLTALGVGSTLGVGVYVLAGQVAYELSGPAVIISFVIAAVASVFAGLCYAEFAARVPRAGSAYIYSYVTVGELVAFTIGWNLILEYGIGVSSVARGMSGYIDALFDKEMSSYLKTNLPIDLKYLAEYPDFLSFFIALLITALLCSGVKESSAVNNVFTVINIANMLLVVVAGSLKADLANWSIPKNQIPDGVEGGEGGFFPFGITGVIKGAATCFFAFIGFDAIATTGEEAKHPHRNIPLSIIFTLFIVLLAYLTISIILTLMLPYYLQDPSAPLLHAFEHFGWIEIKWIVAIGAIFALCTSLLGCAFPLPRIVYSMALDGLILKSLSNVHPKTKSPVRATLLCGSLAAVLALIFDLAQLIDMMSIGTLLAYTIVAICVLILHYRDDDLTEEEHINLSIFRWEFLKLIINWNGHQGPSRLSSHITQIGVLVFTLLSTVVCVIITITEMNSGTIAAVVILAIFMVLAILIISRQPVAKSDLTFQVPLVPLLPCVSVFFNLYLMVQLEIYTWIRFVVWILIGYLVYFTYGLKHSVEGKVNKDNLEKSKLMKLSEEAINEEGIDEVPKTD